MKVDHNIFIQRFWTQITSAFGLYATVARHSDILTLARGRAKQQNIHPDQYIQKIAVSGIEPDELAYWASELSVNETYFYRNRNDWEFLRSRALPDLLTYRKQERTLAVLSAGCSSGEEPLTVAMMLDKEFPQFRSWNVTLYGGDIDRKLLDLARTGGPYSDRSIRHVPEEWRQSYFVGKPNEWFIADSLRDSVEWIYLNLKQYSPTDSLQRFHLIFCRNVLIYFEREDAVMILRKLHAALATGGILILGHTEGALAREAGFHPTFENGCVCIRKPAIALDVEPAQRLVDVSDHQWLSVDELIRKGKEALQQGLLDDAKSLFTEVLLRDSSQVEGHYHLGILSLHKEEVSQALRHFEEAIAQSQSHHLSYLQAALAYQKCGMYYSARRYAFQLLSMLESLDENHILDTDNHVTVGFARMLCERFLSRDSVH